MFHQLLQRPNPRVSSPNPHSPPKPLKSKQEIAALGPQYDRTKMVCRGATRKMSGNVQIDIKTINTDLRGDEPEMNL
jgi:hypothetical protein